MRQVVALHVAQHLVGSDTQRIEIAPCVRPRDCREMHSSVHGVGWPSRRPVAAQCCIFVLNMIAQNPEYRSRNSTASSPPRKIFEVTMKL